MKTTLEYLFRLDSPWIFVGLGEPERLKWNNSSFYCREGMDVCVRRLRGRKMRTKQGLMNEFAAALQFFDGFGENWDALAELLSYMDEWLPAHAYVLIVESADELLQDEDPQQLITLMQTLHETGSWWARPIDDNRANSRLAKPFHALLHVRKEAGAARMRSAARDADVPIREK